MSFLISTVLIVLYYVALNVGNVGLTDSNLWTAFVWVFVPIVAIPLFVAGAVGSARRRNDISKLRVSLLAQGFTATHELPTAWIDVTRRRAVFYEHDSKGALRHWELGFKAVLGTEVVRDGGVMTRTSASSLVGRALVGGVVLGGVGILIGGLTAKSTTGNLVKKLSLEIVLDCPEHPVHRIPFLDAPAGTPSDGFVAKAAAEQLAFAQSILELMMMGVDIPQRARSPADLVDTLRMLKLQAERGNAAG